MSKATLDAPAKAEEKISPLLKMVLELGPLAVFFFANSRGEWLAEKFPVLAEMGGPIFIATGLFMAATLEGLLLAMLMVVAVMALLGQRARPGLQRAAPGALGLPDQQPCGGGRLQHRHGAPGLRGLQRPQLRRGALRAHVLAQLCQ